MMRDATLLMRASRPLPNAGARDASRHPAVARQFYRRPRRFRDPDLGTQTAALMARFGAGHGVRGGNNRDKLLSRSRLLGKDNSIEYLELSWNCKVSHWLKITPL